MGSLKHRNRQIFKWPVMAHHSHTLGHNITPLRPAGCESRTDGSDVLSYFRVKFSSMFVLLQRIKEKAHAFLDKEVEKLWRDLFPDCPQCSESQREEEVHGEEVEHRRRARKGVVDITRLCMKQLKLEELADTLWSSKILLF